MAAGKNKKHGKCLFLITGRHATDADAVPDARDDADDDATSGSCRGPKHDHAAAAAGRVSLTAFYYFYCLIFE
jgi:hypothetical protein